MIDFVEAQLRYSINTGEKPISASHTQGGRLYYERVLFDERCVTIQNGRPFTEHFSIDRHGFAFVEHETRVTDFLNEAALRSIYYPEIELLVKQVSGASRVLVFDHTIRSSDELSQQEKQLREPLKLVHNDYTEWSGPQRVRDLLPEQEAEALLKQRFAVIQVWRPTVSVVRREPLALCDARSVNIEDFIKAERRHTDRIGEIYHVAFNTGHKWFYFPEMQRNEALVFKCYDSCTDGTARFTPHCSFDDPATPEGAPPRESIEVRALAFFSANDKKNEKLF